MSRQTDYLWTQVTRHARTFFAPGASAALTRADIRFTSWDDARHVRSATIAIPIDIPAPAAPRDCYDVPFNGTTLRLWNRLPMPQGPGWAAVPSERVPLWFRHESGTLIPAWNLFANLFDLLTFREERESPQRDSHGRFLAQYSPRIHADRLEVPAFNDAVAALVDAAVALGNGTPPPLRLDGMLKPPILIPSHDCDLLRGNDRWTQMIRLYRIVEPLRRLRLPSLSQVWWFLRSIVRPRDFYLENVRGIIVLESMFGVRSAFYVLSGTGGRFGARSGSALLPQLREIIPDGWQIGMHYNFDTHLDHTRFAAQQDELTRVFGHALNTGRAHYLRFDSEKSPAFYEAHGILVDESAGYPDRIGYRCGVAGCFQPWDAGTGAPLDLVEVPMAVMDGTLVTQYPADPVAAFERLLAHLQGVGGALSVVVHPGLFFNPEFPKYRHLYYSLLKAGRAVQAEGMSAGQLAVRFLDDTSAGPSRAQ